jgi:hypothetical protein
MVPVKELCGAVSHQDSKEDYEFYCHNQQFLNLDDRQVKLETEMRHVSR